MGQALTGGEDDVVFTLPLSKHLNTVYATFGYLFELLNLAAAAAMWLAVIVPVIGRWVQQRRRQ